ncbi:hypothetical protein Ctob_015855 [Chrysochromulina tobinii]|uniref:BRCT domain-containing protein n=1 Tax=Chrysochromulina tobinii TaxID=1460289 RepID=A0A0M0KA62_9EUKA|nr:hypothetical protein Ctob_015855 [Chrysochromulina tobinii]|eukprot:KOO35457.1 hypothetical protein Ctob_015855 [Chrysochromulina sp. CCMP291]
MPPPPPPPALATTRDESGQSAALSAGTFRHLGQVSITLSSGRTREISGDQGRSREIKGDARSRRDTLEVQRAEIEAQREEIRRLKAALSARVEVAEAPKAARVEAPKAARAEVAEAAAKKTEASANANAPVAVAAASSSMAAGDEDDEEIVITSLATETPTTTPSARVAAAVDLGRCRQLDEASCFAADLACCRQRSEVNLAELKGDQGRSREITLSEVDLAELKGDQGRSRELKRAAAAVQRGAPSMSFQGDGEGRAVEDDGGAFEDDGGAAAEEADEAADAYEEASDLPAKTTPAKGVPASAPSAGAMPRVPANSPAANLGRGSPLQSRSLNSSAQDARDSAPGSKKKAPKASRSQRQPLANAPRIAFSSASHADAEVLKAIAQSLGAHVLGDGAAEEATHLVLGSKTGAKGGGATGAKRTLKVLQAILRGAWVLSEQWLFESLDADELLPEAGFETSAFVGARRARERRQADVVIDAVAHAKACSSGGASARRRGDGALVSAEWLYDSVSDCERKPVGAYQPVEAVA